MKKTVVILLSIILCTNVFCGCAFLGSRLFNNAISKPQSEFALQTKAPSNETPSTPSATLSATQTAVPNIPTPSPTPFKPKEIPTPKDFENIEAVLAGAPDVSSYTETSKWSGDEIVDAIYGKLLYIGDWEEFGLTYTTNDGYVNFNLAQIKQLAKDTFGVDLPATSSLTYAKISGDQFIIMLADGYGVNFEVQSIELTDQTAIAKGAIVGYGGENTLHGFFEAILQRNSQSKLGYTLVYLKTSKSGPEINLNATASSSLIEPNYSHLPQNVLDNSLSTAWVEGVSGLGEGQWIKISTNDNSKMKLSVIEFDLGFQAPERPDLLDKNSMPTKIHIECDNGYTQVVEFYSYNDIAVLDSVQETSWVKFTILEASRGLKFDDTCISEIRLFCTD